MRQITSRVALLTGFAVVFALWLGSTVYFLGRLHEITSRTTAMNARHDREQNLLLTVKAQVLLASIYVRDALDEPDPGSFAAYRRELLGIRDRVDRALQEYVPNVDLQSERDHWSRLLEELKGYWETMLPVLTLDATRSFARPATFVHAAVVPKRDVVLEISERIRALDADAFQQEQQRLGQLYLDVRRRVWAISGLSVLLGFGIAGSAIQYAGRLESRIREQHREATERRSELQQLSSQLVRAQEDERRRIARDLHDEIGQALTAIDMQVAVAERHVPDEGTALSSLHDARAVTERALRMVRDLSELLHPAILDDFGLAEAIAWQLQAFSSRTGIAVEFTREGTGERMPMDTELSAYRIAQEALTNVARHAQASVCQVRLARSARGLHLSIRDDGRGFDPAAVGSKGARRGLGLIGIRQRVDDLGGTVRIRSGPGAGTVLEVELPAPRPDVPLDPANSSAAPQEAFG